MVETYLYFGGRLDEAIEFYRDAIGLEVVFLMRYKERPTPLAPGELPPGFEEKVMHASLRVGSTTLSASDGCETHTQFQGFGLRLMLAGVDEVDRAFHVLARGGKVTMPLETTFWSKRFGMVIDRFGLTWMVSVRE